MNKFDNMISHVIVEKFNPKIDNLDLMDDNYKMISMIEKYHEYIRQHSFSVIDQLSNSEDMELVDTEELAKKYMNQIMTFNTFIKKYYKI